MEAILACAQRDPQKDWTTTQNRVSYDVFARGPIGLLLMILSTKSSTPTMLTCVGSATYVDLHPLVIISVWTYREDCQSLHDWRPFSKDDRE